MYPNGWKGRRIICFRKSPGPGWHKIPDLNTEESESSVLNPRSLHISILIPQKLLDRVDNSYGVQLEDDRFADPVTNS